MKLPDAVHRLLDFHREIIFATEFGNGFYRTAVVGNKFDLLTFVFELLALL